MTLYIDQLDPAAVSDRESFLRFAEALIRDRAEAEDLERQTPDKYRYSGANDWQNGQISEYLDCALAGTEAQRDGWDHKPASHGANWLPSCGWGRSMSRPALRSFSSRPPSAAAERQHWA